MKMKFVVLAAALAVAGNAAAYKLYESTSDHVLGTCDSTDVFSGYETDGYWSVTGPNGNGFSRSRSEAIRKACGE